MNYELRLKLTAFINSRLIYHDDGRGHNVRGVFIPLDINGLNVVDNKYVWALFFVNDHQSDTCVPEGFTHSILPMYNKSLHKKLRELGFKCNKNFGAMRPPVIKWNKKTQNHKIDNSRVKNISD